MLKSKLFGTYRKPAALGWLASFFLLFAFAQEAAALPLCPANLIEAPDQKARESCEKPWLLLIHMAADNNLAPYALLDLYELQSLGSTVKGDVVIQMDLPGETGVKTIHVHKAQHRFNPRLGPKFFENKTLDSWFSYRHLGEIPEPSRLSEERKLRDFIIRSSRQFPARQTLVSVWGHGKGWTSLTLPHARSRDGGVGFSESSGRFLGIPALKRALSESATQVRNGRKWDLFLTDACLMQMAEVATELAPTSEILLGSSQNQDYLGVPYRKLLELMNASGFSGPSGTPTAAEVAMKLPELMRFFLERAAMIRGTPPEELDMGMSAIHSGEWTRYFVPSFQRFISALVPELRRDDELRIRLKQMSRASERFESGAVELGNFLRGVDYVLRESGFQSTYGVRAELTRAIQNLDRAVLAYSMSSPSRPAGKRSVSLWVPAQRGEFQARTDDFAKSALHQSTELREVLRLLSQ